MRTVLARCSRSLLVVVGSFVVGSFVVGLVVGCGDDPCCADDSDCVDGASCFEGTCALRCDADAQCDEGQSCLLSEVSGEGQADGAPVPAPGVCRDSDANAALSRCPYGES